MRSAISIQNVKLAIIITALLIALSACVNVLSQDSPAWQEEFNLAGRELAHSGESTYFILRPRFQTILESQSTKLTITVLDETREIGGITTRVVEEREEKGGELIEISRNFFAIDQVTGDVFYFGEEVDDYRSGQIVGHGGAWLAYENGNQPGLIMPGNPKVGMKYYQELAPGIAMDRAEVISVSETFETPAGEFKNCLVTQESSSIQPLQKEYKTYAPGIGLVQDEGMKLTSYGYVQATSLSRSKFQAPSGLQSALWPLDCGPARAKLDPLSLQN